MILHRLHVPGRTSARKHQVLNYLGSFKNSAFKGLAQGPVWTTLHSNFRGMSSLAVSAVLKAMFLLKLPIFFHLKWKQHKFSNYFQKAWFKLWLSSLWPKCIRPRRQQNPLTTAGISKQRQQGGCREAAALAHLPSWREGRQARRCSSPHALWEGGALCPYPFRDCFACPAGKLPQGPAPTPPLTRGMNSEANWEARNGAGA